MNTATQPKQNPFQDAFASEDLNSIAALYYGIYDRVTDQDNALANIVVAPIAADGSTDWSCACAQNLESPSSDSGPADIAEARRWAVLLEHIDACDSETSLLLWVDSETGQPMMEQLTGPDADGDIAQRIIGRDISAAPRDKPYEMGPLAKSLEAAFYGNQAPVAANDNIPPKPIDVWQRAKCPPLPKGLLPEAIEDFATIQSDLMGADAAGLAMAALASCAAAIPDTIEIQPKEHDPSWTESPRLWVALVGLPSTMKSPMIAAATKPLKSIDARMYREYAEAKTSYDELSKDDKKNVQAPRHTRLRLEDTTIEAAQEVLKDSPEGVLLI